MKLCARFLAALRRGMCSRDFVPANLVPDSELVLVVYYLEMSLHVVRAEKLLLTAMIHTYHCLLSSVDFTVPRGVAGSREGLVASMGRPESARVPLRALRQNGPACRGGFLIPVPVW